MALAVIELETLVSQRRAPASDAFGGWFVCRRCCTYAKNFNQL